MLKQVRGIFVLLVRRKYAVFVLPIRQNDFVLELTSDFYSATATTVTAVTE